MNTKTSSRTHLAYGGMFLVTAVGVLLPHIAQPEQYHLFADQRTLAGIPHFADVVSNLIFMLVGALGLVRIQALPAELKTARIPLMIFFLGLALTGFGSSYYHWAPTTAALLWDRLPMVLAFAGIIGTFLTQRVNQNSGLIGVGWALSLGAVGLADSATTGNLSLYLALQFGGLIGILLGLCAFKNRSDPFPWCALLGWYALAKALELGDTVVWELTAHLVSGHTLKHLAAGMAGAVAIRLLRPVCPSSRFGHTRPAQTAAA